jgi:hypothetical protein
MSGTKAPMLLAQKADARQALGALSKAALADLVVDLLRRIEGDEALDGERLVASLDKAFAPVRALRTPKRNLTATRKVKP